MSDAEDLPWTEVLFQALKDAKIDAISYVPDEGTGALVPAIEADPFFTVFPATREEEGVGLLTGAFLGGKKGALLIQASGVGNLLNALASVNLTADIPLLMIIGQRGGLGEFNPCQTPGGRAVPAYLSALGVSCYEAGTCAELADMVDGAASYAFTTRQPAAVIVNQHLQKGKRR